MVGLIDQLGGEIRYKQEVKKITEANGSATGVELANGEHIKSDIVVSNADSAWTYKHLLKDHKPKRWSPKKIERAHFSMSLFVWYFGTNKRFEDVYHHLILLGPRYQGLLSDIFKAKKLADDFSLYLHRPTATDPSLAPPGCDTFYVLSPVPHLDAQVDWSTLGDHYRDRIAQHLGATILPNLDRHLVSSRLMTPLRFEQDLLSFKGSAFSFEPTLAQSAYFRPHNRSEDIDGLYLVGAGTHPGAGVPGVLSSARVLDSIVPAPHAAR